MKSSLGIVLIALLGACDSRPEPSQPFSSYRRPAIEELLKAAVVSEDRGVGKDFVRDAVRTQRDGTASQALWDTVKRAEAAGLRELYGMETFGSGEVDYSGHFFLLLEDGRAFWLFADGDFHENGREDIRTVPAWPVGADAFAKLRRRFEVELPLTRSAYLASAVLDGGVYLLHAYRDGQSHCALWYEPTDYREFDRDVHRKFVEAFPVSTLTRALWAAVPADSLPAKPDGFPIDLIDWYGRAPPLNVVPEPRAR